MTSVQHPSGTALRLVETACPVCGGSDRVNRGAPGRLSAPFQPFASQLQRVQVARCTDCEVLYTSPMVHFSDEFQRSLYNIDYFESAEGVLDLKNMKEKENILDIVARNSGPLAGRTLLDVGCGTGEYLKAASDRGMQVTGIDVDQSLADYIGRKYGHRVVTGLFGDDTFPAESFDVIVLSHVVEHLQEPAPLLRSIHRALKPDGLFVMCTPNFDSLMEALHDLYGKWRHGAGKNYYLTPFTSPYHVVGFNLRSTRRLLARTGFSPVYAKVHSGLEWEANRRSLPLLTITLAGAMLGKGMCINTVSRKQPA
jgi:2-polyprenyl-3-methyl-5-hydroxy-6-metoxy-1,4-benzoquinol methylase